MDVTEKDIGKALTGILRRVEAEGYYRLNSGSHKGLSLKRFHGRLAAFG